MRQVEKILSSDTHVTTHITKRKNGTNYEVANERDGGWKFLTYILFATDKEIDEDFHIKHHV